jgi:serine/threonine protein kinase
LLVGRILGGRYRVEEVIGRGGMGAVYRATDEQLGRQVALKVITPAGSLDPEARERLRARFRREARSAAALPHHPNVVPVYDYGSDEPLGLDYLVMELLRGSDLASRLNRSGPPALAAAIKILIEAARGIAVGHQQGLIHRDVKPGNIFLTQTHSNDVQVRVVDFGIAKLADDEDTLAQLTQDGRVPHSPAYASPEQLRGLAQLTPAADVFGLGAVGYQLLTGERPFTESDRNRMSLGMPVDAPSTRARNPAVPGAVDAVIRRALSYEPAARFANAGEMATELERAMRGIADMPVDPYLGAAAIVTAAGDDRTALDPDDDDRTALVDLDDDDDRTLAAPPPPPPSSATPRAGPASQAHRPEATPAVRPPTRIRPDREKRGLGGLLVWAFVALVLIAAAVWALSEMQRGGGLTLDLQEPDTVALPEDTLQPVNEAEAEAARLNGFGVEAHADSRYQEALDYFRRAVQLAPDNYQIRRNYGATLLTLRRYDEAERELNRAVEIDPTRPAAYANLGRLHIERGDTTRAVTAWETFLARNPTAAERRTVESYLREIEEARQPIPLLGEPIPGPRPTDPPPAADTVSVAPSPGAG